MSPDLTGRIALITGASGGIGVASAQALAAAGATVVVSDLKPEPGTSVVRDLTASGSKASFVACDVTDEAAVRQLVRSVVDDYGRLDIAHNNAGITGKPGPLSEQTTGSWNAVVAVNLTGVFLCMREELAIMREQRGGVIINTASNAGVHGVPNMAPYAATKFAVIGMTRCAAIENGPFGIRINAVCPGFTRTPMLFDASSQDPDIERRINQMVPLGRIGEPDEIAQVVLWLASDASSYVTGVALVADGGRTAG